MVRERQAGLDDRFKEELAKKVESILLNPLKYPLKGVFYEARLDDFPYLVIFKIDNGKNLILVISVFHTSRNPKKKYK